MSDLLEAVRRHRLGLFTVAVLVAVAWILWSARGALPPFVIGVALALVMDPLVAWLARRGLPRWASVLVVFGAVVVLVWLLIAYAITPVARQLTDFINHLPQLGASLVAIERDVESWYRSLGLPVELRSFLDEAITRGQQQLGEVVQAIIGPTLGTLVRTVTFIFGLVVIPVWLFFVLKDVERLPGAVTGALPPAWRADATNLMAILARVGGRWVRGELLLGVAVFSATAAGLLILTLAGFREFGQFTLVLALIAGVLEWFPVIGPIVAAIPMLLVGITISPAAALAAVVLATAVQQLENNILVPKVMGDAVELHPAVLIVALVVGGALFGIAGAILAAPAVAIGRDLYRYAASRLAATSPSLAFATVVRAPAVAASEPVPVPGPAPNPPADAEAPPAAPLPDEAP